MPQVSNRNPTTNRVSLKPTARNGALKPSSNANAANVKPLVNQAVTERVSLKDAANKNTVTLKANPKNVLADKQSKANAENQILEIGKSKRVSLKANAKPAGENKSKANTQKSLSNSKATKKSLKATDKTTKLQEKGNNAPANKANKNQNGMDFVIFCDENDQLAVTAVQKEQKPSTSGAAEIVLDKENLQALEFKKTVLQEKRVTSVSLKDATTNVEVKKAVDLKVQQVVDQRKPLEAKQPEATLKLKPQTIQPQPQAKVQPVKPKVEIKKSIEVKINVEHEPMEEDLIIESLKLDETLSADITLDESGIEELDKENDPSLMSVDNSVLDTTIEPSSMSMAAFQLETCAVYSNDVYKYILARERQFMADPMYMQNQPDINSKMRSMLVDWLVDVSIEYKLESETVFLAVSYIDRFLSNLTITLSNFQLLGTAALFIASKYEEIYPPEIREFIYITDDAYTKPQMLSMEQMLLKSLNFNISTPTPVYFLKKLLCDMSLPSYVEYFAEFMCFLTLLQIDPFLHFTPSDIAIGCILYSVHVFGIQELVYLDDFKQIATQHLYVNEKGERSDAKAQVMRQNCLDALHYMHKVAASLPHQAVYQKYSQEAFECVARTEVPEESPILTKLLA